MRNIYLRVILLIGLSFLCYGSALSGGFIWDDVTFIAGNDLIHQSEGLWKIWFTRASTDYWPLTYSLFWFFWRWFGLVTWPYHLINLIVHIANALLLWKLLTQVRFRWPFAVALLFGVHPVNVEAVAWIFQLKTTLSTFFAFVCLYYWLRFLESDRGWRFYGFALGALWLALLTKASVVLWPFVLLGAALLKGSGSLNRRSLLKLLAPFFILSLLAGLLGLFWYPFNTLSGGEMIRTETPLEKWILAGWAFWFYVGKALWPNPLIFIYPRWQVETLNPLHYLPLLAAVLVGFASIFAALRRHVGPLLTFSYFTLTLLPVLGVMDIYFMRYSFVADHWQYLALPATLVTAVDVVGMRVSRLPFLGGLTLGVVSLLLAGLTFQQTHIFHNEFTLWTDTIEKNPHAWLAQSNLGGSLLTGGHPEEALPHLLATVAEKPNYVDAYNNLGAYYMGRNDLSRAKEQFDLALTMFPNNARAYNNLAVLAMRQGHPDQALSYLKAATTYVPDYIPGLKNLAQLYMDLGRKSDAALTLKQALRVNPDDQDVVRLLQIAEPPEGANPN